MFSLGPHETWALKVRAKELIGSVQGLALKLLGG